MLGLPLGFMAPAVLAGLLALPVLWWLLRVTPPRPQRIDFPPLKLVADLIPKRETPARTPWWLLLLRLAIAAMVILAAAGPILNPQTDGEAAGRGPLLILVDNGAPSARDWPQRQRLAESLLATATREGRAVALAGTAEPVGPLAVTAPAEVEDRLRALPLRPHLPDRRALLPEIQALVAAVPQLEVAWIADGVRVEADDEFARRLAQLAGGRITAHRTAAQDKLFLGEVENQANALNVRVLRAEPGAPFTVQLRASDQRGAAIGEAQALLGATATEASASFALPIELRNAIARIDVVGERSAGAVALLDDSARRRRVGSSRA